MFLENGRLPLVLIALLTISCATSRPPIEQVATTESPVIVGDPNVILEYELPYGIGGAETLWLHLARPAKGEGPFPALLFFCGNGWGLFSAGRNQYVPAIKEYAAKGYVAVSVGTRGINIRKDDKVLYPFPAAVEDAKCAVRWLRANAGKYNIRADRIGVVGWSSGGTITLLLALTDPKDGFEGSGGNPEESSGIQAAVSIGGIVDCATGYAQDPDNKKALDLWLGGSPEDNPAGYKAASPITYVRSGTPPILIFQDEMDRYAPLSQAQALDARLTEVGSPHVLEIIPGMGHRNYWEAESIAAFLDKTLKKP